MRKISNDKHISKREEVEHDQTKQRSFSTEDKVTARLDAADSGRQKASCARGGKGSFKHDENRGVRKRQQATTNTSEPSTTPFSEVRRPAQGQALQEEKIDFLTSIPRKDSVWRTPNCNIGILQSAYFTERNCAEQETFAFSPISKKTTDRGAPTENQRRQAQRPERDRQTGESLSQHLSKDKLRETPSEALRKGK